MPLSQTVCSSLGRMLGLAFLDEASSRNLNSLFESPFSYGTLIKRGPKRDPKP